MPAKDEMDYKIAGLSKEENKKFWLKEKRVNRIWYLVVTGYICLTGVTYSSNLFFVKLSTFSGFEIQILDLRKKVTGS